MSAAGDLDLVDELERAKLLLVAGSSPLRARVEVARAATKGMAAFIFRSFDELEGAARRDREEALLRSR